MIMVLHNERRDILENIKGACEETTTGVHRLEAMNKDGALEFHQLCKCSWFQLSL